LFGANVCFVFSHQRHALLLCVFVFAFRQLHLFSLLRRPLVLFAPPACPVRRRQLTTLSLSLSLSLSLPPQKANTTAGQPATCATTKGASGRQLQRPPHCCHPPKQQPPPSGSTPSSTPSPWLRHLLLLLERAFLVDSC
jgi:hypothetical protein